MELLLIHNYFYHIETVLNTSGIAPKRLKSVVTVYHMRCKLHLRHPCLPRTLKCHTLENVRSWVKKHKSWCLFSTIRNFYQRPLRIHVQPNGIFCSICIVHFNNNGHSEQTREVVDVMNLLYIHHGSGRNAAFGGLSARSGIDAEMWFAPFI